MSFPDQYTHRPEAPVSAYPYPVSASPYDEPTRQFTGRFPVTPVAPVFQPIGPQTYTTGQFPVPPKRKRRRTGLFVAWVVFGVLLVVVGGAVMMAVLKVQAPSAAQAKAACKAAIEAEAQGRLENAQRDAGDSAVPSVAGVDIDEPVRTASGYTVNGTIRFAVLSFLGALPAAVFVTCTATIKGTALETDVQNR